MSATVIEIETWDSRTRLEVAVAVKVATGVTPIVVGANEDGFNWNLTGEDCGELSHYMVLEAELGELDYYSQVDAIREAGLRVKAATLTSEWAAGCGERQAVLNALWG